MRLSSQQPEPPRPRLRAAQARALVASFLSAWHAFPEDLRGVGEIGLECVTEDGKVRWRASLTPAIDVHCTVVVADAAARVTEAHLVGMRTGAVIASWP